MADFRIRLASRDAGAQATFLPWDSKFFKRPIYRLDFIWAKSKAAWKQLVGDLEKVLEARKAAYCFAIIPEADAGINFLIQGHWNVVETRVMYWRGNLASFKPARRFAVRLSKRADLPWLEKTVVAARNPWDRFRGDSFYSDRQVDALMREWIRTSVRGTFADAVIVPDLPRPKAFITLRHLKGGSPRRVKRMGQMALIAVHPDNPGWFPKLASEALLYFRSKGIFRVTVTTQSENRAVIRTLESLGFHPGQSQKVLRKVFS